MSLPFAIDWTMLSQTGLRSLRSQPSLSRPYRHTGRNGEIEFLPEYLRKWDESYAFVDAGALIAQRDRLVRDLGLGGQTPPINLKLFADMMTASRVFWYDAAKANAPSARGRSINHEFNPARYHQQVQDEAGFVLRLGELRGSETRTDGKDQKEVDVMLAIEAVRHAAAKNMRRAVIVTSDLDFRPLIAALSDFGVSVHLMCGPSTNMSLMEGCDEVTVLYVQHLLWIMQMGIRATAPSGTPPFEHGLEFAGEAIEISGPDSKGRRRLGGASRVSGISGVTSKKMLMGLLRYNYANVDETEFGALDHALDELNIWTTTP